MTKQELKEKANALLDKSNEESTFIGFESVENPLIEEIEDTKQIKTFFEKTKYVPYAGSVYSSGHSLLRYYDMMAVLSSTSYGILQSQKNTAFSGKPHLLKSSNDIFSDDLQVDDTSVYSDISEIIRNIKLRRGETILDLPGNIYDGVYKNGNIYIEVVLGEVLREKVAAIYLHKQKTVLYNLDSNEYENLISISPSWDREYLKKYPTTDIPVFPEMKQFDDGTIRTIIHVKRGGGKYYGRPRNEGCFYEIYREHQGVEYLVKQAANEFSGRVILEAEDADTKSNRMIDNSRDKRAGYKGTSDRFEKNFTYKAKNPRSFIIMSRPYGARAMSVYQLKPMTNEKFHLITDSMAVKKIIGTHGWSKWLLGDSTSSGLSSNMLIDAYKLVDNIEVPNIQSLVLNAQNLALHLIYSWFGREDLTNYLFGHQLKSKSLNEDDSNTE